MVERFSGDGAAVNGFGRRTLQPWEARMLYEVCYMASPDTRNPPEWKLSAGGIPIPLAPTTDELPDEIQAFIMAMDDPSDAESPDNLLYWETFFADRRAQELARHEGPPDDAPKCNNVTGRQCFWSTSGRTLATVLQHIHAENTSRLGFPRTSTSAARSGRCPPANWLPRRMASLSSFSSASASLSSGSTPLRTPTGPSSALRPVKREAVSPVRSQPRTCSRGIVINEARVPVLLLPTGRL